MALIVGFLALQYFLSVLLGIIAEFKEEGSNSSLFIYNAGFAIFLGLIQACVCFLLIAKSQSISQAIIRRANIGGTFSFIIQSVDLLFVVLLGIGIYLLVTTLPDLLTNLFLVFKNKASGSMYPPDYTPDAKGWTRIFFRLLLPVLLLMFARPIANYFAKDVSDLPLTMEDAIDEINDHDDNNLA
jgi:hypothetical protein